LTVIRFTVIRFPVVQFMVIRFMVIRFKGSRVIRFVGSTFQPHEP